MRRSLSSIALTASLALTASAGPALAHAHLKSEVPAAGAVVLVAPQALTLTFSESIELKFTRVTVTGPGKGAVPIGTPALDPGDATVLTVPLKGPLSPGKYEVEWHATAADTHKTAGTYSFTLKP